MNDYEFILQDRIVKIQAINEQYDLEHNASISFSGGKDSVVLSHLIDLALPNNNIPRFYANTGIEYKLVVDYVKRERERDSRITILNQTRNIKQTLEKYGYPFKSKEHAQKVYEYNRATCLNTTNLYLYGGITNNGKQVKTCPKILRYQFEEKGKYNYSNLCCYKLKKELLHKAQVGAKRKIIITGMRQEEGGNRARLGCTIFDKGKLLKFHPLIVVSEQWEEEFIKENNIKLCDLYYPPYNFKRTGCKGCPFALDLQNQLDIMRELLPNEYKQCEILWKPVYDEYRRIGYRLSNKIDKQMTIWDVMNDDK